MSTFLKPNIRYAFHFLNSKIILNTNVSMCDHVYLFKCAYKFSFNFDRLFYAFYFLRISIELGIALFYFIILLIIIDYCALIVFLLQYFESTFRLLTTCPVQTCGFDLLILAEIQDQFHLIPLDY